MDLAKQSVIQSDSSRSIPLDRSAVHMQFGNLAISSRHSNTTMLTDRTTPLRRVYNWTASQLLSLTLWSTLAVGCYELSGVSKWLTIPWLPISLVGTAVAFYVGFKNDSAYDRMWEARKVWGAIVNSSRAWGTTVKAFVSNQFVSESLSEQELQEIRRRLVHRHIAWLYALRSQLLMVKEWEHAAQGGKAGRLAERYQKEFGIGLIDDEITSDELHRFLTDEEFEQAINFRNTATQLIDRQSSDLHSLYAQDLINDFRHMQLQKLLADLYVHQGKAERIKNFPLPRQYANPSSIFVGIFLFLLPFGMATEFAKIGPFGVWWAIPFTVLVGWVFTTMEAIGDYSENPFQGMANDIPMYSLCRTIEIDLREMLGESDLPEPVKPVNGILM